MAKKTVDKDASPPQADPLLKQLEVQYSGRSLSPVGTLERIAKFDEKNRFRTCALLVAQQFLAASKLEILDRIFDRPQRIDVSDREKWVANTRALTYNALIADQLEFMVNKVHPALGTGEIAEEVWSILRKPYEEMIDARDREDERQRLLAQSQVAQMPGPIFIGPGRTMGGPQTTGPNPSPARKIP